ncbi:sigma-54-dependent Fis family transcriptional regulator [Microvirga pudoricolor]|uniref:sigma-54-dependent Fis family transcriptional regulator n=1 Tax=Microvirga pudoricolor TaxID=2778729 RepID=UPI001951B44B|nr:sigma-54-dependent Fis family transcriptional regulator [Microvirga pudoricolor]MBM6593380.1 sigma-54-dependent Fis family transcriptional regulator [Microvirga pudoricolor]
MVSADAILTARRQFFSSGTVSGNLIPRPILRSWSRCAAQGLRGAAAPRIEPLTAPEITAATEPMESFRRFCRPEIEALHADAEATDSIVILTDARGVVLDTVGSSTFARQAARVTLRPGMPWDEAATGTNAIGTALAERAPIAVRGAEHYFECNRILTCSAAPIFGPRGEVVGVLDLSGPADKHQDYALGLVRLAAEQIEHRLFERGFEHCERIRLHHDPAMLGTAREGVLVFEDGRLIAANRHGLHLAGLTAEAFDRASWSEIFRDRLGAFADGGQLRHRGGALLHGRLEEARSKPRSVPAPPPLRQARPGRSPDIRPVFGPRTAEDLARTVRLIDADVPVLVTGETGSGKEVFARAAHAGSSRAARPFVAVNCAALPESLMESELFGYEAGAFTGARARGQRGMLREAEGGMLFLDEIGDMPLPLQTRLLRVLQEREVVPLGNGRPVAVDFALVCATNRNLNRLVEEGAFRADLYFRIAPYTVAMQPLSALPDRAGLIVHLWDQMGGPARGIALGPDCLARLAAHNWPGNYRQLVGCLRAMLALGETGCMLGAEALPLDLRDARPREPAARAAATDSLDGIARQAMREAVEAAGGNVTLAAKRLGINRSTLYRRLLSPSDRRH